MPLPVYLGMDFAVLSSTKIGGPQVEGLTDLFHFPAIDLHLIIIESGGVNQRHTLGLAREVVHHVCTGPELDRIGSSHCGVSTRLLHILADVDASLCSAVAFPHRTSGRHCHGIILDHEMRNSESRVIT
jgi:hypothetical protein